MKNVSEFFSRKYFDIFEYNWNIIDEIFSDDYKINNLDTVKKTCIEHIKLLIENKAEKVSVGLSKKHLSWYLKGFKNSSIYRKEIMYCENVNDIIKILKNI